MGVCSIRFAICMTSKNNHRRYYSMWNFIPLQFGLLTLRALGYIRIHIPTYAHTCKCTFIYIHIYMYVCICTCIYLYIYRCSYLNVEIYTYVYIYIWSPPKARTPLKKRCKYRYKHRFFRIEFWSCFYSLKTQV